MVNTNKILTVSYGTFSCTLEGFDDAFGTMKAIAEYFRDLAADDRYFGAEPPTPDAEMLARIAEREIARRVEARLDNDKVHLRVDPGSILPVAALDAAATGNDEADDQNPAVTAPMAENRVAEDQVEAPAETEAFQPESAEDERAWTEDREDTDVPNMSSDLPPAANERAASEIGDQAPLTARAETAEDNAHAQESELAWSEDDSENDAANFFDTTPSQPAADTLESVAAKLSRIRAVVSQERTAAEADYSEDEHAEDFVAEDMLADTHEDIEAALALDDAAEIARTETWEDEEAQSETGTDDISALIDRYTGAHHHTEAGPDAAIAEEEEKELATDDFEPPIDEPEAFEAAPEPVEATFHADELETDLPETDAAESTQAVVVETQIVVEAESVAEQTAETDSEESLFVPVDEDTVFDDDALVSDEEETGFEFEPAEPQARARVIKMKRADFEAAIASGEIEEDEDLDSEDATSLSPEDEADLLRELAAVQAELDADETAEDAVAALAEDDDESEDTADDSAIDLSAFIDTDENAGEEDDFAALSGADEDDDDASEDNATPATSATTRFTDDAGSEMARMFDMADSQMDDEAGKGRRNAIAHLRAAVAAAKAEGGKINTHGPDTEAYRDDLDSVVRPRRPEVSMTHTRRPNATKPAPLKLVAEQRVDLDTSDRHAPIRPRRVSAPAPELAEAPGGRDGDFAEYAETMGAHTLPELLEAAAAYLSFVEGRKQFSRPQLMTQVRQAELEEFSREDGLRSFGQLLREGKIEKLEGGRFKASESISYRPSKRYAGE